MENSYETLNKDEPADPGLQIIRHPSYQPCGKLSLPWFDLRVFYVRISNFLVDDLTPESLSLNHIPLTPDTLLEVNGVRCSIYSEGVSSLLRRDRVDKKSEEATFVSTDSIRLTGSVKFEVLDKGDLVLSGVLEMSNSNGFIGESKNNARRWSMNCESAMTACTGFLKGKQIVGSESLLPTIEVYVAGCFLGTPIILTKTLQINLRKKHNRKGMLDSIPEYETTESQKDVASGLDLQVVEYRSYKPESEEDYNNMYWRRTEFIEDEDGELSWFNAGVRVGVGIGLGICLGIGIGAGLLVRTYQATTRNFGRRRV
uniref:Erythronate-4-phosphate dehydrogenase family protein n=2 Tax=Davidia involucrata TaxID=16924 RepID=A0A5B7B021_DAVIN